MESIDPRTLLTGIAGVLERLGIAYAVTGGMAVFVWGRPRFTADIDVIVQLRQNDADRLVGALRKFREAGYISEDAVQRALARHGEFNFIDDESGMKVDFWALRDGAFERSQMSRRRRRNVLGKTVFFVSPEDLVLSKLRWLREGGSSRQLEDIQSVLKFQPKADLTYIRRWAKQQGTLSVFQSLVKKVQNGRK